MMRAEEKPLGAVAKRANVDAPQRLTEVSSVNTAIAITPTEPATSKTQRHPGLTSYALTQLIRQHELTVSEQGALYIVLEQRPDWLPEVACMFIKDARAHGNAGVLSLLAVALHPNLRAHPGGASLPREHSLSTVGSIWDYIDLLNRFIEEDSKDHWRRGNCRKPAKTQDADLANQQRCSKHGHAEVALSFLRLAAADPRSPDSVIDYYTGLARKYGASKESIDDALTAQSGDPIG